MLLCFCLTCFPFQREIEVEAQESAREAFEKVVSSASDSIRVIVNIGEE